MSQKFKNWKQDRRPKKFRKLTSMSEGGYDHSGGRSHKERRRNDRQNFRQNWHQDLP